MTTVPRLFPGSTVVVIGTGPSLTQEDVDFCRDKARVIVVNDAFYNKKTSCMWADVLYGCDFKWWSWRWNPSVTKEGVHLRGAKEFEGLKYSLQSASARFNGVQIIRNLGRDGLTLDPTGVKAGHNSVYQSIGVAVHLGAKRICLLGVDMHRPAKGPSHVFGEHRDNTQPPYAACIKAFGTLVAPLKANGIQIVNCTPGSALRCFRMASLQEFFAGVDSVRSTLQPERSLESSVALSTPV